MGFPPEPVSDRLWAPPEALSVTLSEPERVPTAVGVKLTLIEQLAPVGSVAPQLFVSMKSPAIVITEIVSGALPVLDSVALWEALVVPTG